MTPKDFINTFRPLVLPIAKKYNVPASVLLAQMAIESRWGKSELSKKFKNLSGMKAIGKPISNIWDGSTTVQKTKEDFDADGKQENWVSPFRAYKNYTQSVEDLAHRHAIRFKFNLNNKDNDINKFIDTVVSTGYATGTGYSNLINTIIDQHKLYDLDKGSKFVKQIKAATPTNATKPTQTTPSSVAKKK